MWEMVCAGFWRLRVRCALALCQALRRQAGRLLGESSHPPTLLCRTCVPLFDRAQRFDFCCICASCQRAVQVL